MGEGEIGIICLLWGFLNLPLKQLVLATVRDRILDYIDHKSDPVWHVLCDGQGIRSWTEPYLELKNLGSLPRVRSCCHTRLRGLCLQLCSIPMARALQICRSSRPMFADQMQIQIWYLRRALPVSIALGAFNVTLYVK